jgi:hypothetical protein
MTPAEAVDALDAAFHAQRRRGQPRPRFGAASALATLRLRSGSLSGASSVNEIAVRRRAAPEGADGGPPTPPLANRARGPTPSMATASRTRTSSLGQAFAASATP